MCAFVNKTDQKKTDEVNPDAIPLIVVKPFASSFEKLIERYKTDSRLSVTVADSSINAISIAKQSGPSIILCHGSTQVNLAAHASTLNALKQAVRAGQIRILITVTFKQEQVIRRLIDIGFSDVINEPINDRALAFKIDRHLKIIDKYKKDQLRTITNIASKSQEQETQKHFSLKASSTTVAERRERRAHQGREAVTKISDPLTLKSDCWILGKGTARRIAGRWMFKLKGPGSEFWKWVELHPELKADKDKKNESNGLKDLVREGKHTYWEFRQVNPTPSNPFIKEPGSWIFRGEREPEFHDDLWWFVDPAPEITFFSRNGTRLGAKVALGDDGSIILAADSPAALQAIPHIEATLVKVVQKLGDGKEEETEKLIKASAAKVIQTKVQKPRAIPPLTIASDCWLIRQPGKKLSDKWQTTLWGPQTQYGYWLNIKPADNGEQRWKWAPFDPATDPYIKQEGEWIFDGQCPKIEDGAWIFVGTAPKLGFYTNNECLGFKINVSGEGDLLIAKDSTQAMQLLADRKEEIKKRRETETGDREDYWYQEEVHGLDINDLRSKEEEELKEIIDRRKKTEEEQAEYKNSVKSEDAPPPPVLDEDFRLSLERLGGSGGRWEDSGAGSGDRKWYVYLPQEALNKSVNVRNLSRYWTCLTSKPPTISKDKQSWIFNKSKPQSVPRFADLAGKIQIYLISRTKKDSAIAEDQEEFADGMIIKNDKKTKHQEHTQKEEKESTSPSASFFKQKERTDEHAITEKTTSQKPGQKLQQKDEHASVQKKPHQKVEHKSLQKPQQKGEHKSLQKLQQKDEHASVQKKLQQKDEHASVQKKLQQKDEHASLQKKLQQKDEHASLQKKLQQKDEHASVQKKLQQKDEHQEAKKSLEETVKPPKEIQIKQAVRPTTDKEVQLKPQANKETKPQELTAKAQLLQKGEIQTRKQVKEIFAEPAGSATIAKAEEKKRKLSPEKVKVVHLQKNILNKIKKNPVSKEITKVLESLDKVLDQPEEGLTEQHQSPVKHPATSKNVDFTKPIISPLAMAFLMSEAVQRRDIDTEYLAYKFTSYLSSSCCGARAELWYKKNEFWACAGTNDKSKGQFGSVAGQVTDQAKVINKCVVVTPVSSAENGVLGAVVMSAESISSISLQYLSDAVRSAIGLLLTIISQNPA